MNKYLFAGIGSLLMTALLFSFVVVFASGNYKSASLSASTTANAAE